MTETTAVLVSDDDEPLLNNVTDNSSSNSNHRCPTCQGTGLVATSPGLVALIPLDDARLKRRHTLLWIMLTIIFCTIIASAVIFTILPRSVNLSMRNPVVIDATNDSFRNTSLFRLTFMHQSNLHSENWVPIRLINLTASVEYQLLPVDTNGVKVFGHKTYLGPLGRRDTNITVELDFEPNSVAYRSCQGIFRQMLLVKLQTTLNYADFLLGRIQTASSVSYQYVLCNKGEWKPFGSPSNNTIKTNS